MLPGLPSLGHGLAAAALVAPLSLLALSMPRRYRLLVLAPMWAALAGLLLTWARADHRLADALADHNENKVSRVVLRVARLPDLEGGGRQSPAQAISSLPDGVPIPLQGSLTPPPWLGPE